MRKYDLIYTREFFELIQFMLSPLTLFYLSNLYFDFLIITLFVKNNVIYYIIIIIYNNNINVYTV